MIDEMVFLNAPIAEIFASGEALEPDLMNATQIRLGQLLRDFEALGRPPDKLVESYEALEDALTSFETAYNHLETALEAQSTNPFSARFLESAHGAGAAIHQAYSGLPSIEAHSCSDL